MVVSQQAKPKVQSLRHRVREGIENMILAGELQPGERLVQEGLASQFQVAQGVVRESLLELSCSGLVNAVDNLGIFVSELDGSKVVEALEIREMLEGLAARLCCRRASRENIDELKQLVDRIHKLGLDGKADEASLLDRQFHQQIVEIAGNSALQAVTNSHWTLRLVLKMTFDVEIVHQAHTAIVNAIDDNNADLAEQLMREHVRSARNVVEQRIADGEFVPEWLC